MPLGSQADRHDDVTDPKVECRANLKDCGKFLNDDLAAFFDFRLELTKLLKFVELHCDASSTVFKLKLRFEPDGLTHLELRRNDKPFNVNLGASLWIGLPIEVGIVDYTIAGDTQPFGFSLCNLSRQE